jgi:hypothetical protein
MSGSTRGRWFWLKPAPFLMIALAGAALMLPACASWDGQLNILGYTTKPNYDLRYKTIKVPVFRNRTPWNLTPVPGMEMDLTKAVVREINWKTPYQVVTCNADTELRGTIVNFNKSLLNYTQMNNIREAETDMKVEVIWRDLRTGEILSKQQRRPGQEREPETRQPLLAVPPGPNGLGSRALVMPSPATARTSGPLAGGGEIDDDDVIDPHTWKKAIPIVLQSTWYFRPELGESITTAMQRNMNNMAVQIISVMENSW